MTELTIGKFVSSSSSEEKIRPISKGIAPMSKNEMTLKVLILTALGEQCIKNKLDLDLYKSVSADFDKESNSVLIKVSF